jgi:hypothetical protein
VEWIEDGPNPVAACAINSLRHVRDWLLLVPLMDIKKALMNRYSGEIHINPVSILRNYDFNNEGDIADIHITLKETIAINQRIIARLNELREYLSAHPAASRLKFNFAPGGYIEVKGLSDHELLKLNKQGLLDLFDYATDRDWVKRHGHHFGLIWEDGRAVSVNEQ